MGGKEISNDFQQFTDSTVSRLAAFRLRKDRPNIHNKLPLGSGHELTS